MHDTEGQSPVSRQALKHCQLVFDAIYTPLRTQLIQVKAAKIPPKGVSLAVTCLRGLHPALC